jgi:GT2 family glycosyltransferase
MSPSQADVPAVSVVTATRNRPQALRAALLSIKAQSFAAFESIVVDDGSDAETLTAYDSLWSELDNRFRLMKDPAPGGPGTGPAAARNRGVRLARGEFVAFLDDDDVWTNPDHLAVGIESLRRTGADYYFANMVGIRRGQVVIPDWFPDSPELTAGPTVWERPAVHEVGRSALLKMMRHHLVHPDTSVIRRALLQETGGFLERVRFSEDYNLMMRLADRARRVLYRPDIVAHYRLPEADSVSSMDSRVEHALQMLACTQHIRLTCLRGDVRRCARAREGWTFRQLAGYLHEAGRNAAALSLAWQAVCVFPTLGAWAGLARSLGRSLFAQLARRRPTLPAPGVTATAADHGALPSVS